MVEATEIARLRTSSPARTAAVPISTPRATTKTVTIVAVKSAGASREFVPTIAVTPIRPAAPGTSSQNAALGDCRQLVADDVDRLTRADQRRAELDEKRNQNMAVVVGPRATWRIGHRGIVCFGRRGA